VFELRGALEARADAFAERRAARRLGSALSWWRGWRAHQARKREWRAIVEAHMSASARARCLAAWRGRVLRKAQLRELEAAARGASARASARAALRGWRARAARVASWRGATAAVAARRMRASMAAAFGAWRGHARRRQLDQEAYDEILRRNVLRVWGGAISRWRAAADSRRRLAAARAALQTACARRCLVHWKARVDYRADWQAFQGEAVRRLAARRWGAGCRCHGWMSQPLDSSSERG
jgi:hypothetical protein